MILWKCCTQYVSKFGKLSSGHRTGKYQFLFQSQRKAMPKNVQMALISHTSKVMLKILQVRLQQYMNWELPDVQAGFRKGRGARDQIANICWIIEKAREFQKKNLPLLHWLCQSLWLCGSQQTVENSSRHGNTRSLVCLLRNLCAGEEATDRNGHGTTDRFQIWKGVYQGCVLSPSAVILEPPKNKVWHCFHCFPIYFPWSDGTRIRDLSFPNVEL